MNEQSDSLRCYEAILKMCTVSGRTPSQFSQDQNGTWRTALEVLKDMGIRLDPIDDDAAKQLAITTIFSFTDIKNGLSS